MSLRTAEVPVPGGAVLRTYDRPPSGAERLAVVWHHGTPNVGSPPAPLFAAADRLGVRWVGYDRPGYGGSSARPDRDVASAAADVAAVADALGLGRFAVMSHSGGGPHALACAALLPARVAGVAAVASLAPRDADGLDWFDGMADGGRAGLGAAVAGRGAKERFEAAGEDLDIGFTAADTAALEGGWAWFLDVVRPALTAGSGPVVDDDLAYVAPWGFDPGDVRAPVILVHGEQDRVVPVGHARWLSGRIRDAELRVQPDDGHVSVMSGAEAALGWLVERSVR